MHDTVTLTDGVYRVPIFNPGSNRNQVSELLLVNVGEETAAVTIAGVDDDGRAGNAPVALSIPGRRSTHGDGAGVGIGRRGHEGRAGRRQGQVESRSSFR